MRKSMAAAVALGLLAGPVCALPKPSSAPVTGLWINPYHSVAVRNQFCGNALCGQIVWASNEAKADARDSGVPNLIGINLLENYHPQQSGKWKGTVLVPDMGHRFSSEIDALGPDRIKISGCIFHGLLCKSQIWTRIEGLPG